MIRTKHLDASLHGPEAHDRVGFHGARNTGQLPRFRARSSPVWTFATNVRQADYHGDCSGVLTWCGTARLLGSAHFNGDH